MRCGGSNNADFIPGLSPNHSTLSRLPCLTSVPQLFRLLLLLPESAIYRAPNISPIGRYLATLALQHRVTIHQKVVS